jgi:hypothetical protein
MKSRQLLTALLTLALVASSLSGAALAAETGDHAGLQTNGASTGATTQGNDSTTTASTGQRLATVLEVTDVEIKADVERSAFESTVDTENESATAAAIADRAATLRERADTIEAEQRAATEAYQNGDLSHAEYAQRLAALNARATSVLETFEDLDDYAEDVSTLELEAAGYNRSANEAARDTLRSATGSGATALLRQYTGESNGEFSVETNGGIEISVENEDGERSREFEREQPGNGSLLVDQNEAQETARQQLSAVDGNWTLRSTSVDREDGYYGFGFGFRDANQTGEAEVSVDGETGEIFAFEEEIEPREDNEDNGEQLAISVVNGSAAPGATVTLQVTQGGDPVTGAAVDVGERVAGETDADGRLTVTLPADDEAEIEAKADEAEGKLEFDFGADEADAASEINKSLSVTGSADNGTVSVAITYEGEGVEDVTVFADGEAVGTTDADGRLTFDTGATDELGVELVKGAVEAELEFEIRSGSLELVDSEVDVGNDDEADDEDETAEDEQEAEEDEQEAEEDEQEAEEDEQEAEEDEQETVESDSESLAINIVDGNAAPGATVTLQVTQAGDTVAGATVDIDSDVAGETDADGRLTVTLPDDDDATIEAEVAEADGKVEFDFETDEADTNDD